MNKHSRNVILILAVIIFAVLHVMPASADMGPKPSVHVAIDNLTEGHGTLYATLLGDREQYGPYQAADGSNPAYNPYKDGASKAFDAFLDYKDQDGFFFWGQVFEVLDDGFSWTYYPPDNFKILVYDPENGKLYASPEKSRYAFDSYYTVSLQPEGAVDVVETPYLTQNILSFAIRVILTLLIELIIAWIFGYRIGKEIRLIIIANILTQVTLNLLLSFIDYYSGLLAWLIFFPILELGVLLIETIIYLIGLRSYSRKRAVFYAILANLISAAAGFLISLTVR